MGRQKIIQHSLGGAVIFFSLQAILHPDFCLPLKVRSANPAFTPIRAQYRSELLSLLMSVVTFNFACFVVFFSVRGKIIVIFLFASHHYIKWLFTSTTNYCKLKWLHNWSVQIPLHCRLGTILPLQSSSVVYFNQWLGAAFSKHWSQSYNHACPKRGLSHRDRVM